MTTSAATAPATDFLTRSGRLRAESLAAAILLVALSALAPLSVDMFLPSLPAMTEEFAAPPSKLALAVLLFTLSFASSQLVYGPLSDRAGRRPALFLGLTLFIIGGGICLAATSSEMLIGGRVVQGLGGGAGPALAQAIVLDVYGRERATRVIAYMAIALPLAPAIAPIIGGFLHEASGWRSVFLTLISIGALLAVMYNLLLPETNPAARRATRARTSVLRDYLTALSSPTFVAYALVMGLMFGGQLLFISTSAFILITELGLGAEEYGFSFALVAGGIMVGATISSRLAGRLPPRGTILVGASIGWTGAAVMLALVRLLPPTLPSVLGPMFFVGMGVGITRPSATAAALIEFPQMAGLASGLLGFLQMLVASSLNIAYGRAFEPSAVALATGVTVSMSAVLATLLVLRPGHPRVAARAAAPEAPRERALERLEEAATRPSPRPSDAPPLEASAPALIGELMPTPSTSRPARVFRRRALHLDDADPVSRGRRRAAPPPGAVLDDGATASSEGPLSRPAAVLLLAVVTVLFALRALLRAGRGRRIARD
ncbi:MAG: multidrug effflux MFS transporter [Dehalococcoidia bacterium]